MIDEDIVISGCNQELIHSVATDYILSGLRNLRGNGQSSPVKTGGKGQKLSLRLGRGIGKFVEKY